MPLLKAEPKERAKSMSSECRLFTSGVRSDVQGNLGRKRSYTTTNCDFRSATWAGELAADIISGSESFPATALLPCGPAMAAARGSPMVIGLGTLGNVEVRR